jgi:hypothetical protein
MLVSYLSDIFSGHVSVVCMLVCMLANGWQDTFWCDPSYNAFLHVLLVGCVLFGSMPKRHVMLAKVALCPKCAAGERQRHPQQNSA